MCSFTKAQLLFFLGSYIAVSCVHASPCSSDPCRNGGICQECTGDCRYGKPSTCLPCNCADVDEICDMYSGNCPISGCKDGMPKEYGWGGPGCRTGNVAYNASTSAANVEGDRSPARAVDGNPDRLIQQNSCYKAAGPRNVLRRHWWKVDLGGLHFIHNVTIYPRIKYNILGDFEIWVSTDRVPDDSHVCAFYVNRLREPLTLQCNDHARYLKVFNGIPTTGHEMFSLCEVVVMGYKVEEMPKDCEGYTCNCLSGYEGKRCEKASACTSDPCRNGGICEDCTGDCRYGKPSTCFPCDCADVDEICDMHSGNCPVSGCKDGMPKGYRWGGPACGIGNVAYNKSASSSSVNTDNSPARAVDGNVDPVLANGSCFQANGPSMYERQWWQVDLGGLHSIHNVTVYNRDQHNELLSDFRILVSNGSDWIICAFDTYTFKGNKTLQCNAHARYLRVLNGMEISGHGIFALCEVVVMGYKVEDLPSICEGYTCKCLSEYTGQRCEKEISCADFPCLNGGICTDEDQGGISCECTGNYTGKLCGQQDNTTYMEQSGSADHYRNDSYDRNDESDTSNQMDTTTSGRDNEDVGKIRGMIKVYIVGYHLPVYGDDSISLTCILGGAETTDVNIVWKFYPMGGNPRQVSSGHFYSKQDVDADDMGTYTCEARTEWSTANDSIIVFPNERPSLRNDVPDGTSERYEAQSDTVVGTSVGIGVLILTIIIALIIYQKTKKRTPVSGSLTDTTTKVETKSYQFRLSPKNE